jgi:hypothetical protein
VIVGNVAELSEVYTVSIFRVDARVVFEFLGGKIGIWWPNWVNWTVDRGSFATKELALSKVTEGAKM